MTDARPPLIQETLNYWRDEWNKTDITLNKLRTAIRVLSSKYQHRIDDSITTYNSEVVEDLEDLLP